MGACTCIDGTNLKAGATSEEIQEAYQDAVDEAHYDSGHGGYSGTISESQGLTISNLVFDDYDAAYDAVDEYTQKWGPAVAITIKDHIYLAGCYSS